MDRKLKLKVGAGVAAAAAVAGGGAAIAADRFGSSSESQAVVNDAAKQLGVTPSALSSALKKAVPLTHVRFAGFEDALMSVRSSSDSAASRTDDARGFGPGRCRAAPRDSLGPRNRDVNGIMASARFRGGAAAGRIPGFPRRRRAASVLPG